MRSTALVKFDYVAEYWDFTETINNAGVPVKAYYFSKHVPCLVLGALQGGIWLMSREPLRLDAQVRSVIDRMGNEVLKDSTNEAKTHLVYMLEPQMNVFGVLEGYKHQIRQTRQGR